MKIAILCDTHCGIRNSSEVFLDNAEDFYTNIFFPECQKQGITQILHLGDYYEHRKFVNFKALNQNRRVFLDQLRKNNMKHKITDFTKFFKLYAPNSYFVQQGKMLYV